MRLTHASILSFETWIFYVVVLKMLHAERRPNIHLRGGMSLEAQLRGTFIYDLHTRAKSRAKLFRRSKPPSQLYLVGLQMVLGGNYIECMVQRD